MAILGQRLCVSNREGAGLACYDPRIGGGTRFRTLDATPYNATTTSYSSSGEDNFKMAADSPVALYTRIFGEGFSDPNSGEWKPDDSTTIRWSGYHGFRRGLASNLLGLGVNPKIIQAILRHSDVTTTLQFYTLVPDEDTRIAMQKLEDSIRSKVLAPVANG